MNITLAPVIALIVALIGCDRGVVRPPDEATSTSPAPRVTEPAPLPEPTAALTPAPVRAARSASRIESRLFASSALGVTKRFEVYLPAGYDDDGSERFPVLYLLHGLGGNETNAVEHGHLKEAADELGLRAIVVMPDGDASFYIDSPSAEPLAQCLAHPTPFSHSEPPSSFCVVSAHYETYIVSDLVRYVDRAFRTIASRRARGIAGISMGGFGAMMLAMRHTDVFAAAASHSGLLSLRYVGPHPYRDAASVTLAPTPAAWGAGYPEAVRDHVRSVFGSAAERWREHDPIALAANLDPKALALYIDCGDADDFHFQDHARHLHDVLVQRGIDHTFAIVPGQHLWTTWRTRLPASLAFFARTLAK